MKLIVHAADARRRPSRACAARSTRPASAASRRTCRCCSTSSPTRASSPATTTRRCSTATRPPDPTRRVAADAGVGRPRARGRRRARAPPPHAAERRSRRPARRDGGDSAWVREGRRDARSVAPMKYFVEWAGTHARRRDRRRQGGRPRARGRRPPPADLESVEGTGLLSLLLDDRSVSFAARFEDGAAVLHVPRPRGARARRGRAHARDAAPATGGAQEGARAPGS